ncbi:MAG: hypothetical protein IPL70_16045 [Uliginosibacterium sp.]|nr:hypothetical protein [Uliginosibacterium sp.]
MPASAHRCGRNDVEKLLMVLGMDKAEEVSLEEFLGQGRAVEPTIIGVVAHHPD